MAHSVYHLMIALLSSLVLSSWINILCDSIFSCLIIRAEQTCWWPNHNSQPALSVYSVLIGQLPESWSLIGGITITGQTSSHCLESSGSPLMAAVSPVLVWLCLFLIMGCYLITYFRLLEFFNFFICFKDFKRTSFQCWILENLKDFLTT